VILIPIIGGIMLLINFMMGSAPDNQYGSK